MKRLGIITTTLLLTACAHQSDPSMLAQNSGSLAPTKTADAKATQQVIGQCMRDGMRAYPNVPSYSIWDACLAAVGRPQMTQRIQRF